MDRSHISIEKLRRSNISEAVEVLAQAFYDNPLPMHAFGKLPRGKRLARVRRIYRGMIESALLTGHVYVVRRNGMIAGAAIAYAPNSRTKATTRNLVKVAGVVSTGMRGTMAYNYFGRYISQFEPPTPHWHLYAVGVAPSYQRQGIGEALVKHFNRIADKDNRPSFLTTAREDQVPFYSAQGYKVTNVSAVPKMEDIVVRVMQREVVT